MRQALLWGSAALLLLLSACGNGNDDGDDSGAVDTPAVSATSVATGSSARTIAGDPPASPATQRIEQIFSGVALPPKVEVFGRRDIPNDAVEKDAPDAGLRFREYGRITGNYYVLTVNGAQRMTLSINQYQTPEGAGREFDFGKGNPSPEDIVKAESLGEARSAHRASLGDGGNKTSLYLISFTRGCYYVVIADFPPGGADAPPDSALALAQAIDDQLAVTQKAPDRPPGCDPSG